MLSHLFLHWCHKLPAQSLLPSLESCSTTCPGTPEKQGTPERQGSSLKTAAPDDPQPHFFLLIWGSPGWAKAGAQLPLGNDPATIAQPTSLCHVAQGSQGDGGRRGGGRGEDVPQFPRPCKAGEQRRALLWVWAARGSGSLVLQ